jgi:hypothetical protein
MTFVNRSQFIILYGERVYSIAKAIEQLHQKYTRIETHIIFLKKCKYNNVIPHGLQIKDNTNIKKNRKLLFETSEGIKNNLLEFNYKQHRISLTKINTQSNILAMYLNNLQPDRDHQSDLNWMNKHDKRIREKLIIKHEKKLNTLINETNNRNKNNYNNNNNNHMNNNNTINNNNTSNTNNNTNNFNNNNNNTPIINDTSNVINKSNFNLPEKYLNILSKGLKFVPTQNSLNIIEMISNTEKSLSYTPSILKKAAIAEISTFILKWKKPHRNNITKEEYKLLGELKRNNDIIIVPADKGGKIVVMNKDNYIIKIEEKLNNIDTYQEVKDPTNKIKKNISEITSKLFKQSRIKLKEKFEFTSIDNLPVIRGQPKIHKQDHPMRIITCSKNSITSNLSKFIFSIIKDLRKTINNCITSSNEFIKHISKVELQTNDKILSLDIEDLYTNNPRCKSIFTNV